MPFSHGGGGGKLPPRRGKQPPPSWTPPPETGRWGRRLLLVLVGIYAVASCVYVVGPDEKGLVLRLGRYTGTPVDPGIHLKLPLGLDNVYRAKVKFAFKEEFGYRTVRSGQVTQYEPNEYDEESRHVTGDHSFDEIIKNRDEIENESRRDLNQMLTQWKAGVQVHTVRLQHAAPPREVAGAFNEVNKSQQEMERTINEALAEYNREIPAAQGKSQRILEEAEGYKRERVNLAKGEGERFRKLVQEYALAKEVTRRRLQLETLQEVLGRSKNKVFVSDSAGNTIKWLELRKPRAGASQ